MRILSIRQPWAWLIVNGLKDIENRNWTTGYRGSLLIHAGKQFEDDAIHWILARLDPDERQKFPMRKSAFQRGGIVGIATLTDVVTTHESKWFVGRYGFVLKDAQPLPFMPLPGQLGLFDAPNGVLEMVIKEFEGKK